MEHDHHNDDSDHGHEPRRRLPLFPIEPEPPMTPTQRLTLLATR